MIAVKKCNLKELDGPKTAIVAVIQEAAKPVTGLQLNSDSVRSLKQRQSPLGRKLYQAWAATMNSVKTDHPYFRSWDSALTEAGLNPKDIHPEAKWTRKSIIAVIKEASKPGTGLDLRVGSVRSPKQRELPLGAKLFQAYGALIYRIRTKHHFFPSWNAALAEAGRVKWSSEAIVAVIQEAAKPETGLALNVHTLQSKNQRKTDLGTKLYRAYRALMYSLETDHPYFPSWDAALVNAGLDLQEIKKDPLTRKALKIKLEDSQNPATISSHPVYGRQSSKESFQTCWEL